MNRSKVDKLLVDRLTSLYTPANRLASLGEATLTECRAARVRACYEHEESIERHSRSWHLGRVRYFVEELERGAGLTPIVVDNLCSNGRIYPEPIVIDGHHRLIASKLTGAPIILAEYSGRIDLLRYLTGHRKTCPAS